MAKIKYCVKENKNIGTHSFYAVPVFNGTLTFDEVCKEACEKTTIEPSIMRAAVEEYMSVVKRNVLKGFRVPIGNQFLTVYPNLSVSVKDEKDDKGNVVKPADISKLTAANGKSRLGATVHKKFSMEFANEVSWQKVDAAMGYIVDDDEDVTDGGDSTPGGGGDTSGGGIDE